MLVFMFVVSFNSVYAKEEPKNKEINSKVIKRIDGEKNGYIEVTLTVESLDEVEDVINDFMYGKQEVGVNDVIQTYDDGSTLSLRIEDVPVVSQQLKDVKAGEAGLTLSSTTSATTKTTQRTFVYTYTNIFGNSKTAFTVLAVATYVADGVDGYMVTLTAQYNVVASSYTVYWGSSVTPSQYMQGVEFYSTYMGTTKVHYILATYNPWSESVNLSTY